MPTKPMLDRDTYRAIKKMSRDEMQAFLMRYAEGLRDGTTTIELRYVEKDIKSIRGIGEKRAEEVMSVFEKHLGI